MTRERRRGCTCLSNLGMRRWSPLWAIHGGRGKNDAMEKRWCLLLNKMPASNPQPCEFRQISLEIPFGSRPWKPCLPTGETSQPQVWNEMLFETEATMQIKVCRNEMHQSSLVYYATSLPRCIFICHNLCVPGFCLLQNHCGRAQCLRSSSRQAI